MSPGIDRNRQSALGGRLSDREEGAGRRRADPRCDREGVHAHASVRLLAGRLQAPAPVTADGNAALHAPHVHRIPRGVQDGADGLWQRVQPLRGAHCTPTHD